MAKSSTTFLLFWRHVALLKPWRNILIWLWVFLKKPKGPEKVKVAFGDGEDSPKKYDCEATIFPWYNETGSGMHKMAVGYIHVIDQ